MTKVKDVKDEDENREKCASDAFTKLMWTYMCSLPCLQPHAGHFGPASKQAIAGQRLSTDPSQSQVFTEMIISTELIKEDVLRAALHKKPLSDNPPGYSS